MHLGVGLFSIISHNAHTHLLQAHVRDVQTAANCQRVVCVGRQCVHTLVQKLPAGFPCDCLPQISEIHLKKIELVCISDYCANIWDWLMEKRNRGCNLFYLNADQCRAEDAGRMLSIHDGVGLLSLMQPFYLLHLIIPERCRLPVGPKHFSCVLLSFAVAAIWFGSLQWKAQVAVTFRSDAF